MRRSNLRKKSLYCPLCGSRGEDMVFAFYCMNPECPNFRDTSSVEEATEYDDDDEYFDGLFPYCSHGHWPYGD